MDDFSPGVYEDKTERIIFECDIVPRCIKLILVVLWLCYEKFDASVDFFVLSLFYFILMAYVASETELG